MKPKYGLSIHVSREAGVPAVVQALVTKTRQSPHSILTNLTVATINQEPDAWSSGKTSTETSDGDESGGGYTSPVKRLFGKEESIPHTRTLMPGTKWETCIRTTERPDFLSLVRLTLYYTVLSTGQHLIR